ncbi:unnamed protein product, partial [Didymodactylos carnosus]
MILALKDEARFPCMAHRTNTTLLEPSPKKRKHDPFKMFRQEETAPTPTLESALKQEI